MQWRSASETRFATPVSRISGLSRGGILRLTAWLGISVRTGLPRAGIWPAAWLGISVRTGLLRSLEPIPPAGGQKRTHELPRRFLACKPEGASVAHSSAERLVVTDPSRGGCTLAG